MGSQKEQDELTVLVTGFGVRTRTRSNSLTRNPSLEPLLTFLQPFRDQYPVNPSWEIAKGLPSHLPALRAKDPASRQAVDIPPVRIVVHPEPIRVNYKVVRELVPTLWETSNGYKADLVIHIGMAGPRPVYQIERRGHRTGYKSLDVDGEKLEDEGEGMHGEDWIWHGLPDEIETDLDMPDILERWQGHSSVGLINTRVAALVSQHACIFC